MHFQTSHLFENCIVVYASWGQIQKLRSVSQRNIMLKTKKTNAKDVVLHFDLEMKKKVEKSLYGMVYKIRPLGCNFEYET